MAVAVQPDGNVVVLFQSQVGAPELVLVRFRPDGTPDVSFGDGGRVDTGWNGFATCSDLVLQPDGGLLVSADIPADVPGGSVGGVGRFHADGTPDTSFGDGGAAAPPNGRACDLHARPDGRIVAALSDASAGFAVTRFLPDGTVDGGFGAGGVASIFLPTQPLMLQWASAVTVQADGRIVAAGGAAAFGEIAPHHVVVARFRADGSNDTSFDGDGGALVDVAATATDVAVRPNGRILVLGSVPPRFGGAGGGHVLLAQFTPAGPLDRAFGFGGVVWAVDDAEAHDLELLPDGLAVVAGGEWPDANGPDAHDGVVLTRHLADGRLDNSFGSGGISTTDHFAGNERATALTVQADGRIVTAGAIPPQGDVRGTDVGVYRFDVE